LQLLVVNTGHLPYGGFAAHGDAAWREAFDLVAMSAVRAVRAALPALRPSPHGSAAIVFIGSASTREPRLHLLSNTMRAAVAGLAKTLAQELSPDGIRVNTFAPGYVATGRIAARMAETGDATEAEAFGRIAGTPPPLGRVGRGAEIADMAAMLASPRAGYATGTTVTVDGGLGRALLSRRRQGETTMTHLAKRAPLGAAVLLAAPRVVRAQETRIRFVLNFAYDSSTSPFLYAENRAIPARPASRRSSMPPPVPAMRSRGWHPVPTRWASATWRRWWSSRPAIPIRRRRRCSSCSTARPPQ
jgi:hypothetical protein